MNLKENYERFFGKMNSDEDTGFALTESQLNRFSNLSRTLGQKYPNAPLTLKEGFVFMGRKKVQPASEFLKKSGMEIQEMVRVFSSSGKTGLL